MHVHMLDHMDLGFKPLGGSFYRASTTPTRPILTAPSRGTRPRQRAPEPPRRRAFAHSPTSRTASRRSPDSAGTPPLPIDQRDLERVQIRAIAVPPHFDRPAGVVERDSGDREHRRTLVDLEDLCFLLRCGSGAHPPLRDPEAPPSGSKHLLEAVLLH